MKKKSKAWALVKATFKGFVEDKIAHQSGALAYYTVFSLGPLFIVIISFCGLFLAREAVEGQVYQILQDFVGRDAAAQLQEMIKNTAIQEKNATAAIISCIVLFIGATSVFAVIQDSINGIWKVKPEPRQGWLKIIKNRFLSFSLIISLGFLLLVSLIFTGLIEKWGDYLRASFPDTAVILFYILSLILNLIVSALIFMMIFKVLPDAHVRRKEVITGAVATSCLFLLGKFGISFYITHTKVGSTFGAAGAIVILLVWIYYSAIILYLGAEFTKAYALSNGARIRPNDYAVSVREVEERQNPFP